jgi:long-chain acyl-CoA synthetase
VETLFNFVQEGMKKNRNGRALQYQEKILSYEELSVAVLKKNKLLQEKGITAKCKVAIVLSNPMDYILNAIAVSKLNAVILPIYPNTGVGKIEGIVSKYDINYIISSVKLEYESIFEDDRVVVYKYSDEIDESMSDVMAILFTSGTTNTPKAIMLTNDNISSNVIAISAYLKPTIEDNILLIKSLYHSSTLIGELLVGLYNGCFIVVSTQLPVATVMLNLLEQKEINIFFAVPSLLKEIIVSKDREKYNLNKLRIVNFYGAPMNVVDIKKLSEVLPNTNIIYSYGQTEASPRVTYIERKDLLIKSGSSGKAIQGVKIDIINDENQSVKPFEKGQIVVCGPNVMKGYYRNEEKTIITLIDGWLHTGDIGYLDEDGFLYVVGRKDNMVISAGKNIYLEEIENILNEMNGIKEVLVQAKLDENSIARIESFVILSDKKLTVEEIQNYCLYKLENYKVPRKITIVDYLEKTNSGKIKRKNDFE